MTGRGPNSSLLGHVTRLLFRLCLNFFLPSIFKSFDFCTGMSCIVLNNELADRNVIWDLGVVFIGKLHGHLFRRPKKHKPTKKAFWCTGNLRGIVRNKGCLDYNEILNILPRDVKSECFAN